MLEGFIVCATESELRRTIGAAVCAGYKVEVKTLGTELYYEWKVNEDTTVKVILVVSAVKVVDSAPAAEIGDTEISSLKFDPEYFEVTEAGLVTLKNTEAVNETPTVEPENTGDGVNTDEPGEGQ